MKMPSKVHYNKRGIKLSNITSFQDFVLFTSSDISIFTLTLLPINNGSPSETRVNVAHRGDLA